MTRQIFKDLVLLVSRVLVGVVFVAHAWQKLVTNGLSATADGFGAMGVPLPSLSGAMAAAIELLGGLALILGALTTIAGVLLALNMLGAFFFAHVGSGVFSSEGGWELVGALGAASLALAAAGSGKFGVDTVLPTRVTQQERVSIDA